jgi:hypothetical protein
VEEADLQVKFKSLAMEGIPVKPTWLHRERVNQYQDPWNCHVEVEEEFSLFMREGAFC